MFSGRSSLICYIIKVRNIHTVQWNLWSLHFLFPLHWQRAGGNKEKRNQRLEVSESLKALLFLFILIKSGSGYADEGLQDGDKEREVLVLYRKKHDKIMRRKITTFM